MLPTSANFLTAHLNPAPDLYGPFWTLTTLIFSLFVFSSLASSVSSYLSGTPIDYDFRLLSIATPLVYSYGLGLPVLVWLVLRYLGVSEWGLVEAVSTWGYAQFVWIPVAVRRLPLSLLDSVISSLLDSLRDSRTHCPMGIGRRRVWFVGLLYRRKCLPCSRLG